MLNEFTDRDINKDTCKRCQCKGCTNHKCPVPCSANVPCDSPVVKCKDYRPSVTWLGAGDLVKDGNTYKPGDKIN